ncbi:MAG: alpha/beta hydrolase [Tannerella sp.]|jgi:acetyl esterase/lipase|nr:alpha/beta hydrolase [Tannerella sp.]
MKQLFILFISVLSVNISAQEPIALFPGGAPGEKGNIPAEIIDTKGNKVGGETVTRISNVSKPIITVYPAAEEIATGTAVIVCPGGGYNILAYDLEGTEICEWLNELGVTAVLLKYRVPVREGLKKHEAPLQDAQRAISYVRAHAEELGVNPERIGIMGFSAGAHLSVMASNALENRMYPAIDDIDNYSCQPDFCLLIYPAYLSGATIASLAPDVKVSENTPPTLLIQSQDDGKLIDSSLAYFYALKEAGVPATLHIYPDGGHGYGIRDTKATVNLWYERAEDWFRSMGMIE